MHTTKCINDELCVGDSVVSVDCDSYSYLVGTVISINLVGSPEHERETGNETDDVHVEFIGADYSEKRICEIEEAFTASFGERKTFEDCGLDDVIMSPDMLMKTDAFTKEEMDSILQDEKKASMVCKRILEQFANLAN